MRRTGDQCLLSCDETAHIDRMEAIHVFQRIDAIQDFRLIGLDLLWQRQLYENAMDLVTGIEQIDLCQQFLLRRTVRHLDDL